MTTNHTPQNTLWLIDDDPALRLVLEEAFLDAGLDVVVFANAQGAWAKLNDVLGGHAKRQTLPDVILTDIRMPMMDGLSFSEWVHERFPELPIVIMTAHSDLQSAVDSYQTGAFEYLPKPFDLDEAISVINKAVSRQQTNGHKGGKRASEPASIKQEQADTDKDKDFGNETNQDNDEKSSGKASGAVASEGKPSAKPPSKSTAKQAGKSVRQNKGNAKEQGSIIGQSLAMQTVFRAIGRLSASPITVLITGESGTGKELVAGALHEHSPRADKPFIALNMAAIPHDLIESELFGHEKGAFTGATTARQGRFEQANGGTLFLDEIGDMPFSTQTRLLRVLANGEFFRVGGQKPIQVDVRIVAATHQNLEELVRAGKFREDLFYRLNVIRLPLPPLRERREDIPALVDFFMSRAASEMHTEEKQLSESAMAVMQAFDWSGNVRQLENACRWITVMATGDVVLVEDLPPELTEFARRLTHDSSSVASTASGAMPSANDVEQVFETQPYNDQGFANTRSNTANNSSITNAGRSFDSTDLASSMQPNPSSSPSPFTLSTATPTPVATWQQKLQLWANQALNEGNTDILQMATPEFERVLIEVALEHTRGRKGEAAELLGWGRNTLTRKLKQIDNVLNEQ